MWYWFSGLVAKLCPTLVTPWTAAHQAPLCMELSRQESWSGLPFPSPGDPPNPGIKPGSCALQVDSLPIELLGIDIQYTSVHSIQFNQYLLIIKLQPHIPENLQVLKASGLLPHL